MTTFTLDDLPGVTFTVTRGTGGHTERPSNWMGITAINAKGETIGEFGFAGP